jgi:hypothetical protein
MSTTTPLPYDIAIDARGWDLHVEQAGPRFARVAAGEERTLLWVASVSRGDFALEAQGDTAPEALSRLWDEIRRHCRLPHHLQEQAG